MGVLIGVIITMGISIMVLGLYIYKAKAYHLIAGYDSLSPEEKERFDPEGYTKFFRNTFLLMGFLVVIAYPVLLLFNMEQHLFIVVFQIVMFFTVYLVYRSRNFFKKDSKEAGNK